MSSFSVTICYFFAIFAIASASNVTRCFHCDSTISQACLDPFNEALNKPVECSTLIYAQQSRAFSLLSAVQQQERAGGNFSYVCIKVGVDIGNTSSLVRTCSRVEDNIESTCDFVRQEVAGNASVTMTSCSFCTTDNCNTGALHQVSAVLLGIVLFFASGF